MKTGLRSFDDILNYLSYCDKKCIELEDEADDIRVGFFSSKAKKEEKAEVLAELERYYDTYDEYVAFLEEATTFRRKSIAEFFANYYSAFYGKPFVAMEVFDNSNSKYAKKCDVVASEQDLFGISRRYDFDRAMPIREAFAECNDACINFSGKNECSILEGTELSKQFKGFPEMMIVARALVDLKLTHPKLTDEARLAEALNVLMAEVLKKRQASGTVPPINYESVVETAEAGKKEPLSNPFTSGLLVEEQPVVKTPEPKKPVVETRSVSMSDTVSFLERYGDLIVTDEEPEAKPESVEEPVVLIENDKTLAKILPTFFNKR